MTHEAHTAIRAKVGPEFIVAEARHEAATGGNWAESRNAWFEMTAEGTGPSKEAMREMYTAAVRRWRKATAEGRQSEADHQAAFALLLAESSLYVKE